VAKLFTRNDFLSLEDEQPGELNIDKVAKLEKLEKLDVQNLTQQLLEQRAKLSQSVSSTLEKQKKEAEASSSSTEEDNSFNSEEESNSEEDEFSMDEDSDLDSEDTDKDKDKKEEEKDKDKEKDSDKEEEKEEDTTKKEDKDTDKVSAESMKTLFSPLKKTYSKYLITLESFNLNKKPLSLEEQKVAYVKEDVIKSLNNFVLEMTKYNNHNLNLVEKRSKMIMDMDSKFLIVSEYQKKSMVEYTNELIKDSTILSSVLSTDCKNIRSSVRTLLKFTERMKNLAIVIGKNSFEGVVDAAIVCGFSRSEIDSNLYDYEEVQPGFNKTYMTYVPYSSYLKSNLEEYAISRAKLFKVTDLANLEPILINNKADVQYITSTMSEVNNNVSQIVTILSKATEDLAPLQDKVKACIYDVEKSQDLKLAELPIDDYIKKFLTLKYLFDASNVTLDIYSEVTTTLLTVLDKSVNLKASEQA
jgi:hypothetical protein